MKKKWLRRGIYLFTALLLIVAVLGVGLGSHYLSYYGIRPNPFPELKADEIESISVYYDSEYEFTEEEKAEQAALRREYIEGYKKSLMSQLDNMYIVEPDGTKKKVTPKQ